MAVVSVGLVATLNLAVNQQIGQRLSEERRLAGLAAEQKIDEIRIFINNGKTLDQAFQYYGPLPQPTGGPGSTFNVPTLSAFLDTDKSDGSRPVPRAIGTVSIINDESPSEKMFGYDYANQCMGPPFGVDIDGDGSHLVETGTGSKGSNTYNDLCPNPFPLDLNGNGSDGSDKNPWESNIVSGFTMLPIVITVQWVGANGPRRYDLFTIIIANRIAETQ